jgi:hypothetical protein
MNHDSKLDKTKILVQERHETGFVWTVMGDEFLITFTPPVEKRFNPIQDDAAGLCLHDHLSGPKHQITSLNFSIRCLPFSQIDPASSSGL